MLTYHLCVPGRRAQRVVRGLYLSIDERNADAAIAPDILWERSGRSRARRGSPGTQVEMEDGSTSIGKTLVRLDARCLDQLGVLRDLALDQRLEIRRDIGMGSAPSSENLFTSPACHSLGDLRVQPFPRFPSASAAARRLRSRTHIPNPIASLDSGRTSGSAEARLELLTRGLWIWPPLISSMAALTGEQ